MLNDKACENSLDTIPYQRTSWNLDSKKKKKKKNLDSKMVSWKLEALVSSKSLTGERKGVAFIPSV